MSAHTPGPWRIDGDDLSPHSPHALIGVYVAAGDALGGGRIGQSFANCLVQTDEECRANARLIAAVPDLLEAVQKLHKLCRDCDLENEAERPTEEQYVAAMETAEAAIAKATGSQA